ncbi:hypothetical protein N7533_004027, partial [Penicillium manginii]|uniref:uncharacterized protein n=1 Tax=Penicillium manginii TaxID=203109 RepID=UPI002547F8F7
SIGGLRPRQRSQPALTLLTDPLHNLDFTPHTPIKSSTTKMTDLTPALNALLSAKKAPSISSTTTSPADEFLKEAHRILNLNSNPNPNPPLTDSDRDAIDSSTTLLLHDLSSSITNLSDAETLRAKTTAELQHKKYGHSAAGALLLRWAAGNADERGGKSAEQVEAEEREKTLSSVRESVLWYLRRALEGVASVQRGMVEKRIERVLEKEKSVLYKASKGGGREQSQSQSQPQQQGGVGRDNYNQDYNYNYSSGSGFGSGPAPDAAVLSEADSREIEGQLSAEQLQLFAEENDSMLKHYEDTLGKVQNAERSLVEISSLQETLVTHLTTQGEFISQLVSDVDTTEENIGRGNRELKRATERRSPAQAVFWGTVGLCTWLVVWDLIF